jgi:N-acetylglutamate synthase-like GNAT family acetyltransferase
MEIANQPTVHTLVRKAHATDVRAIQRLLRNEFFSHTHVDWYNPLDWLGEPGFVVYEEENEVTGCLAITADPLPAAWVRLAALTYSARPLPRLQAMVRATLSHLAEQGVEQVLWMSTKRWADRWLPELGFECVNWLEAYVREGVDPPPHTAVSDLHIRPVLPEDFGVLAQLEAKAMAPMWRHSARGLHRGWHKALSFDVAFQHGRVVGFQHSVAGPDKGAHLARITIDPAVQGTGVGTTLLAHAFHGYQKAGLQRVTLNTQQDNASSHHLYQKFGFVFANYRLPVWSRSLT